MRLLLNSPPHPSSFFSDWIGHFLAAYCCWPRLNQCKGTRSLPKYPELISLTGFPRNSCTAELRFLKASNDQSLNDARVWSNKTDSCYLKGSPSFRIASHLAWPLSESCSSSSSWSVSSRKDMHMQMLCTLSRYRQFVRSTDVQYGYPYRRFSLTPPSGDSHVEFDLPPTSPATFLKHRRSPVSR